MTRTKGDPLKLTAWGYSGELRRFVDAKQIPLIVGLFLEDLISAHYRSRTMRLSPNARGLAQLRALQKCLGATLLLRNSDGEKVFDIVVGTPDAADKEMSGLLFIALVQTWPGATLKRLEEFDQVVMPIPVTLRREARIGME